MKIIFVNVFRQLVTILVYYAFLYKFFMQHVLSYTPLDAGVLIIICLLSNIWFTVSDSLKE